MSISHECDAHKLGTPLLSTPEKLFARQDMDTVCLEMLHNLHIVERVLDLNPFHAGDRITQRLKRRICDGLAKERTICRDNVLEAFLRALLQACFDELPYKRQRQGGMANENISINGANGKKRLFVRG